MTTAYRIKDELAFLNSRVEELEREKSDLERELEEALTVRSAIEKKFAPEARKARARRISLVFALLVPATIVAACFHLGGTTVGTHALYWCLGLLFATGAVFFATEAAE